MKHHILVKWNDQVKSKSEAYEKVKALYATANELPFIERVDVIPNVIDRPNRYDLLIVLTLPEASLPEWDQSGLHHRWKDDFSALIEKKAIFDCD